MPRRAGSRFDLRKAIELISVRTRIATSWKLGAAIVVRELAHPAVQRAGGVRSRPRQRREHRFPGNRGGGAAGFADRHDADRGRRLGRARGRLDRRLWPVRRRAGSGLGHLGCVRARHAHRQPSRGPVHPLGQTKAGRRARVSPATAPTTTPKIQPVQNDSGSAEPN